MNDLQNLQNFGKVYMREDENKGTDTLPFLKQLRFISEQLRSHNQFPTYECNHTKATLKKGSCMETMSFGVTRNDRNTRYIFSEKYTIQL